MTVFYIVLAFLSGLVLLLQLVVWVFFGKSLIPDAGELFESRRNKLEWQTIFPKNVLRLIVFVFVGAVTGLLLDMAGMVGWISLPMGALGGVVFNFLLSTVLSPIYFKLHKSGKLKGSELEGMDCTVIEDIDPDGYGRIRVRHGMKCYYYNAVSANSRFLAEGTEAVVIYCEDEVCFVESGAHLFDVLFEEDN